MKTATSAPAFPDRTLVADSQTTDALVSEASPASLFLRCGVVAELPFFFITLLFLLLLLLTEDDFELSSGASSVLTSAPTGCEDLFPADGELANKSSEIGLNSPDTVLSFRAVSLFSEGLTVSALKVLGIDPEATTARSAAALVEGVVR